MAYPEQTPNDKNNPNNNEQRANRVFSDGKNAKPYALFQDEHGDLIDVGAMERHDRENEAKLPLTLLQPRDLIAFKADDPDSNRQLGFTFMVTETKWNGLHINSPAPSKSLTGKLEGLTIPENVANQPVTLLGSGYGGSMMQQDVLITGRRPYFRLNNEEYPHNEFRAPAISDVEIFRKNHEATYVPVDLNQMAQEAYVKDPVHENRLAKVNELMHALGFGHGLADPMEDTGEKSDKLERYQKGTYIVEFRATRQGDSKLTIYDTKNAVATFVHWYNHLNESCLKISQNAYPVERIAHNVGNDGKLVVSPGDREPGKAKITYVTSESYGLNAIDLRPADKDAENELGLPLLPGGQASMTINLFADGRTIVEPDMLTNFVAKNEPPLILHAKASIRYGKDKSGKPLLMLGNKVVDLREPTEFIDEIIGELSQSTN